MGGDSEEGHPTRVLPHSPTHDSGLPGDLLRPAIDVSELGQREVEAHTGSVPPANWPPCGHPVDERSNRFMQVLPSCLHLRPVAYQPVVVTVEVGARVANDDLAGCVGEHPESFAEEVTTPQVDLVSDSHPLAEGQPVTPLEVVQKNGGVLPGLGDHS